MTTPDLASLQTTIERAFEDRASIGTDTTGAVRDAVEDRARPVDTRPPAGRREGRRRLGRASVAEDGGAALLPPQPDGRDPGGPGGAVWWDKVPSSSTAGAALDFARAGFRAVPGAIVRRSAHIAPNAILMPSFVNLGAHVGEGTMVDTWVTVGSCAQIGKNVHLSGGVGIGGVLEPLQAGPTIIEDNCFIGARSEVVEGVRRRRGLGAVDGRLHLRVDQDRRPRDRRGPCGRACRPIRSSCPGHCPASRSQNGAPGPSLYCAVIVKRVDERTRAKTSINDLLRD